MMSKAWLLLADGTVYEGEGFGAAGKGTMINRLIEPARPRA